eukprot:5635533-Amphidinium_carterae.1
MVTHSFEPKFEVLWFLRIEWGEGARLSLFELECIIASAATRPNLSKSSRGSRSKREKMLSTPSQGWSWSLMKSPRTGRQLNLKWDARQKFC